MACLEMYNQKSREHQSHKPSPPNPSTNPNSNSNSNSNSMMSPRISFSNEFAESQSNPNRAYRDAPVSSDFEFSVSNYSMMTADELFFKGRLLPLKEGCNTNTKTTTLRDELLQNDNDESSSSSSSSRPPKNPTRWRGFLGLRKSPHNNNSNKNKADDNKPPFNHHHHQQPHLQCTTTKDSQDFVD